MFQSVSTVQYREDENETKIHTGEKEQSRITWSNGLGCLHAIFTNCSQQNCAHVCCWREKACVHTKLNYYILRVVDKVCFHGTQNV